MTSGKKKSPLAPEVLHEAVAQIGEIARQQGVGVALIGGVALQYYGSDRLTADVDVVSEERLRVLPSGKALSFGGEATFAPNGVPVDVVLRSDEFRRLYVEALTHASHRKGVAIPVAQPHYLAAMKMVAARDKDMLDLTWLILSPILNKEKARTVIKKHLGVWAAREFDRLVEEAQWKASRGRI